MAELYTPNEIARFKAQMEQQYTDGVLRNSNFNTVANMTKNISPLGNLGIMLGTLGGKWAAQQYNNDQLENQLEKFFKAYDRYKLNQALNQKNFFNKAANWIGNTQSNSNLPTLETAKNQFANNSTTPSTALLNNQNQPAFSRPDLSLFGNNNFDWRNQNYFSNVTRPSYLSVS